jgi:superfamily II RNA helicase
MKNIEQQYKSLKMDIITVNNYQDTIKQLTSLQDDYTNSEQYLPQKMDKIIQLLLTEEYISVNENMNKCYDLTNMGNISTNIHEVPSLTFGALIHDKIFDDVTVEQLIQIFSCFTNIVVNDDYISYHPATESCYINEILINIKNKNMIYYDYEINNTLNTGVDYTMHYDLVKYVERWCHTTNEQECKQVLTSLEQEKGIFLGEFIKAILKINNISSELEKVAEYIGDISLLHKLKQIPNKTLKYIATNQSLYI